MGKPNIIKKPELVEMRKCKFYCW